MPFEIKIPAVGESITSGVLSTWHKNDGDAVQAGDALFTLETDKVSTEITAEKAGTLRQRASAGAEVKIGEVVGTIEDGGGRKDEKTSALPPVLPSLAIQPPASSAPAPVPIPAVPVSSSAFIADRQNMNCEISRIWAAMAT